MHFQPLEVSMFLGMLCIFPLFIAIVTSVDLYVICPQLPSELFEEHSHVGEN